MRPFAYLVLGPYPGATKTSRSGGNDSENTYSINSRGTIILNSPQGQLRPNIRGSRCKHGSPLVARMSSAKLPKHSETSRTHSHRCPNFGYYLQVQRPILWPELRLRTLRDSRHCMRLHLQSMSARCQTRDSQGSYRCHRWPQEIRSVELLGICRPLQ